MTVFITGGTSSIGRVLIKQLARDKQAMRVLVRKSSNREGLTLPDVEFVDGDVTDPNSVRQGMQGCDRVYHLAAIVGYDVPEAEWWRVNRDGTHNVLQAAADLGIKGMAQVSSLAVLGPTAPGELADESRPLDPSRYFSLYQKTKYAGDELAREFAAKGLPVSIVYPGFGYGCSWASSHPSMAEMTLLRMAAGQPVAVLGSGRNKLCLAYYKDTVQGIRLAGERGKPGEGYILGGENLTFVEIWRLIAQVLGKQPPRLRIPAPVLRFAAQLVKLVTGKSPMPPEIFEMIDYEWNFSTRKAERELGWQPHSFLAGMTETWADYQAQGWKVKGQA